MIKKKSVKEDKRRKITSLFERKIRGKTRRQEKLRSTVCNFNTKSQTALLAD